MLNITELESWSEQIDILFVILLAVIIMEIGIDFFCHNQRNYKEIGANIAIAMVYQLTSTTIGYFCALAGLRFFSQFSPLHITVNGWTMIIAIAIADFLYYWEHRTEHRIRFFWGYHNVHHSSTDYNLTVASRLSWIEDCILWIFYIPMALLGFHPLQILVAVEITALYQIWIHTQKIGRLGILEKIINTPALHRVHHASNPSYIDKNYGAILMIWDRLFGTYQPETEPPIYGLTENIDTSNPIKIEIVEYQRLGRYILKSTNLKEIWYSIFGSREWKPAKLRILKQPN
ncbi:MAG: sterol desaturase family protein [Xenococcaceae cyanobacterium MO_188.B32]|nr:sterol desaturase family protein [Xenococcaceae cyanobacterium MO_188.B32]